MKQKIGNLWHDKVCAKCRGVVTPEGHDPCIANLPGVLAACCGHGIRPGYILFESGHALYFDNLRVEDCSYSKLVEEFREKQNELKHQSVCSDAKGKSSIKK